MWEKNDIAKSMNQKLGIKDGTTVNDIAFSYDGSIWLASNKGLGKYKNDSIMFFDRWFNHTNWNCQT